MIFFRKDIYGYDGFIQESQKNDEYQDVEEVF